MSCIETIQAYGLRSLGIGERLLPKSDFTLCEQVVLIGSGMIWNVYFAAMALAIGFWFAMALAVGKNAANPFIRIPAAGFIFLFRGSPLFIQFFVAYQLFVILPKMGMPLDFGFVEITVETRWLTRAWLGALIVLFLNTAAYSGEIFYGALRAVPVGDVEAAAAYGMNGRQTFGGLSGRRCCGLPGVLHQRGDLPAACHDAGLLLRLRHGGRKAMRSIMQTTLPTRLSTRSSPIRSPPAVHPDDAGHHRHLGADRTAAEPASAARRAPAHAHSPAADPLRLQL